MSSTSPFLLRLNVSVSLSTGKSTVHIHNISESAGALPDITSLFPHAHDYDFYVGSWMGDTNPHMQFELLKGQSNGTGRASLSIPIQDNDTDMLKLGVFVKDPQTRMMRHISSGYQGLEWIGEAIDGVTRFTDAKMSLVLEDNYSKNRALLHFSNAGTDVRALKALKLRPSALRCNECINKDVANMTMGVHSLIENVSNVSTMNGGPNFVMSACYTQSGGCAINYPLLNMTYSSKRHLAPLSLLSYMSLATLHSLGKTADEVLAMDDHDFVHKFVVPTCTSFTTCCKTMIYSGDKTLDLKGNLDQPTEDFAMVMCEHYFRDIKDAYADKHRATLAEMSNMQLMEHIHSLGDAPCENSRGHFLIADDCETLSGMIKSIDGGIHHESYVLAGRDPTVLGKRMWECTRGMQNLAAVPVEDFHGVSRLLCRYGDMRENCYKGVTPSAQIGLGVVSAKGASFSTSKADLNGHACTVAQVLDAHGRATYSIGEGTTNVRMQSLPDVCPKKVSLVLSEGVKLFDTTEALGIITQNLGEMLATKGQTRNLQTIPSNFDGKDPYTACPFYMAGFFIGFEMGATVPGVIPIDTLHKDTSRAVLAESGEGGSEGLADEAPAAQPMFGAPVAGLSLDSVKAIPINLGRVMGEAPATAFLSRVELRNRETYPPRATDDTLRMLASRWGDLDPLPRKPGVAEWTLSCAEGFECADTLRAVGEYKRRLAREFNALQDKDPLSDGIKMSVKLHMLSVVAHFAVPLPVREKWDLSCARNLRLALKALPFQAGGCVGGQFKLL